MPYGQAYKGLTQQSKKPAPAMMQQPAKQTRCENTVRCSNSSWQRACGRVMNRITHVSQQWRKAVHEMHKSINQATKQLIEWYQEGRRQANGSGNDVHVPATGNRRARRKRCHPQRGLTRGSTPLSPYGLAATMDDTKLNNGVQNTQKQNKNNNKNNNPQQQTQHTHELSVQHRRQNRC